MTFEELETLMDQAVNDDLPPDLLARQIHSNSQPALYYKLLRRLALGEMEPGIFLEIGSYYGCAAAHIVGHGYGILHLGIDLNPIPFSHPESIMIRGDSNDVAVVETVKRIAERCGGIALVLQDSSHHYLPSVREWELYSPLVRPGGIWICDDITPAFRLPEEPKGMVEYFEDLPGDKRLYEGLHVGSRMGIIRMDSVNQRTQNDVG